MLGFGEAKTSLFFLCRQQQGKGKWGGRWDSNPRQPVPQTGVLPLNYAHRGVTSVANLGAQSARASLIDSA